MFCPPFTILEILTIHERPSDMYSVPYQTISVTVSRVLYGRAVGRFTADK